MSEELIRDILGLTPVALDRVIRTVKSIADMSGVRDHTSKIVNLPLEDRARHVARMWVDLTGTKVIPRSKLLYLVGHKPGTVGASEIFNRLVSVLSLSPVKRKQEWFHAKRRRDGTMWVPGDSLYAIGTIGELAVYRDELGEETEKRVRAYLRVIKPVKIRPKELACLVNIKYSRAFSVIVANVIQEMPEYELKIFRYRYGLNSGLVRKITNRESQIRAELDDKRGVLKPHRFATDPNALIAPVQYLADDMAFREMMLEITDRRAKMPKGHRSTSVIRMANGVSGPLGDDRLEDRIKLMRTISNFPGAWYPQEFAYWWDGGAEFSDPTPKPTREYSSRKSVPKTPPPVRGNQPPSWMRAEFVEQGAEDELADVPDDLPPAARDAIKYDGCTLDENGVLRGPDGAKIIKTPGFMYNRR